MGGGYTAQSQLVTTNGHFGAVSIGSRGIFAYVYPSATYESMKKGPAMWTDERLERQRRTVRP